MGTYTNLAQSPPVQPSKLNPVEGNSATWPQSSVQNRPESLSSRLRNLPYKRRTKRSSFEFYEDQLLLLKKLVYEATVNGENLSQSDLVRTALDEFLKNKR